MAAIIPLQGSFHDRVQHSLPWYVNGSLSPDERAMVDAHLSDCAECRGELAAERLLATSIAALPMETERGWAAFEQRFQEAPNPGTVAPYASVAATGRDRLDGGAVGGSCGGCVSHFIASSGAGGSHLHRARVGSDAAVRQRHLDVQTRHQRGTIARSDAAARMVDGPTATGAYVLSVAPGLRAVAIMQLRANRHVALAEPIDAGAQP